MITGENGILTKANNSKNETAKATATEEIQKQFNYYNKLTNKTVLELLTRNALFIEKVDNHIPRID